MRADEEARIRAEKKIAEEERVETERKMKELKDVAEKETMAKLKVEVQKKAKEEAKLNSIKARVEAEEEAKFKMAEEEAKKAREEILLKAGKESKDKAEKGFKAKGKVQADIQKREEETKLMKQKEDKDRSGRELDTAIDHDNEVLDCGEVKDTPKSVNADFGEDLLPVSYTRSLTLSAGRRRAKRKLSLTRRNDTALTRPKCIKLTFSPTDDSLPSLHPFPVVMSDSLVTLPVSPPAAVGSCPPTDHDLIEGINGQLLSVQPKTPLFKRPGKERVSELRQLAEVSQVEREEDEMEMLDKKTRPSLMDPVKKTRRSSSKKT